MDAEASPFETSEMLATFITSTPLLSESWRLCSASAPQSFLTEQIGNIVYVAFSGIQMADWSDPSWRNLEALDSTGDVSLFPSHRNKDSDDNPVMVNAGMLNQFRLFLEPFKNQMLAMMESTSNTNSFVITGHSIGGAIASLCTLWLLSYLQSMSSSISVLCITFGSPLLGNESFSRAILKERWGGSFCHVVSKPDIMPRLLFAPILPITTQLNFMLQFWQLSMTSPVSGRLSVHVSDKEKAELFTFVMAYLDTATQDREGSMPILFQPFGNYFFVSEEGGVCVDSATAVIRMMHLLFATSSPACIIEDHLKYGDYVNKLSVQFLKQRNSMLGHMPDSSYETGLELALESTGIASQDMAAVPTKECLRIARRIGRAPSLNAANLAVRLSNVVPYRAEIEWYKACCDESDDQKGYYDSFKTRGSTKRDMKVNMNRHKLARFWNDVIDMMEGNELPLDFQKREKWVNAPQFYKLLVEPLDIAEYYKQGKHRTKGHYIQHGRERRYEIFDKWWKERTVTEEENKDRSKYASLTQDSCFWARVEEALDWLNRVRIERDPSKLAMLWDSIEKFEGYAMELVENKEVSKDVLAKNSSYSTWVKDLKELRELKAKVQRFPHQFTRVF
ncbi:hypothetical protein L6164_012233 [Bauhinia variegata]|uniref:Uncharacterized protein n=1 Tax=Bauhinia variegata TaxID=167791 RepID=A0ACB9P9M0_BAUVA|nr:hypothetical protein L6164_012233 [Bauhinia variegata]